MAMTPVRFETRTGIGDAIRLPLPSWPERLFPQAQTVWSLFSASVGSSPAARAVTPLRPAICCGLAEHAEFLSVLLQVCAEVKPNWPFSLLPQPHLVAPLPTATL